MTKLLTVLLAFIVSGYAHAAVCYAAHDRPGLNKALKAVEIVAANDRATAGTADQADVETLKIPADTLQAAIDLEATIVDLGDNPTGGQLNAAVDAATADTIIRWSSTASVGLNNTIKNGCNSLSACRGTGDALFNSDARGEQVHPGVDCYVQGVSPGIVIKVDCTQ